MDPTRVTVSLDPEDTQMLRETALALGFVIDRGRMQGQGSLSGLLRAIARGALTLEPGDADPGLISVLADGYRRQDARMADIEDQFQALRELMGDAFPEVDKEAQAC